jgi:hypothetical protein
MTARMAKKIVIFFIPIYVVVCATLPLSYIHVESNQAHSYISGQAQTRNLHLFFHKLIFSHFENKSEHTLNIASVRRTVSKARSAKNSIADKAVDASLLTFFRGAQLAYPDNSILNSCLFFSSSGLSPPSA